MAKVISQVLEKEEKIIWEGNISRTFLGWQIFMTALVLAFLVIFFRSLTQSLFMVLLAGAALNFAYQLIQKFILTDRRLLIKTGLIGADFRSVYFTEVRSADVRVDLIDKIFNIGTISVNIGSIVTNNPEGKSDKAGCIKLAHLDGPYYAYQKFQETLNSYKEKLYSGKK